MNKLSYLASFVMVVVVAGFAFVRSDSLDNNTPMRFEKDGRTLGVHHISLKEDVDAESFETFIRDEFEPVIKDMFPGIELLVMKGERNAEPGEYLLVYDIQSLWIRDYYFPSTSENSDATTAVVAQCGVKCSLIWDRFDELTERVGWADYVELLN